MIDQRLKIAVFIDFDNIEIGVKTTLHTQFDIAAILDGIKERGEVVTKVAYGDWKRAGDYGRLMSQHAIRMVQRNLTPGGDKNGADINLALDALEMAFTHDHINAFVIVGGDSDFITLVEKLKQYDKKVFVVGGRQFTSQVMQKNCHEFIAYENLVQPQAGRARPGPAARTAAAPGCAGRRRQGHSAGEARAQGAGRSRGLAAARPAQEHAAAARLDVLRTRLRRQHVPRFHRESREDRAGHAAALGPQHDGGLRRNRGGGRAAAGQSPDRIRRLRRVPQACLDRRSRPRPLQRPAPPAPAAPAARDAEQIQQIVDYTRDLFGRAAQPPRWPMYVRQFKQFFARWIRISTSASGGSRTIMEFLRVLQREGSCRLERDRRGQIRVFPGSGLPASADG